VYEEDTRVSGAPDIQKVFKEACKL
jgi:hypothetical protein